MKSFLFLIVVLKLIKIMDQAIESIIQAPYLSTYYWLIIHVKLEIIIEENKRLRLPLTAHLTSYYSLWTTQ